MGEGLFPQPIIDRVLTLSPSHPATSSPRDPVTRGTRWYSQHIDAAWNPRERPGVCAPGPEAGHGLTTSCHVANTLTLGCFTAMAIARQGGRPDPVIGL